jgi:hypothetical protein
VKRIIRALLSWTECPVCHTQYETSTDALACGASHYQ